LKEPAEEKEIETPPRPLKRLQSAQKRPRTKKDLPKLEPYESMMKRMSAKKEEDALNQNRPEDF